MREKLKVGDYAVHDCKAPWPNAIYKVVEVDEHGNFRGIPVFRIATDYSTRKSAWLGYMSFRKIGREEILRLVKHLSEL